MYDQYENKYYEVQFHSWTQGGGGGFSYTRSSGSYNLDWVQYNSSSSEAAITFTKPNGADYNDPANWDILSDNVAITRQNAQGLYNPYTDGSWNGSGPTGTEWKWGTTESTDNYYTGWRDAVYQSGYGPRYALEDDYGYTDGHMSLHVIETDTYYDVEWHDWTCCQGGGGFSYTRTRAGSYITSAGDSDTLLVILGDSSMFGGEYSALMNLSTNDPSNPDLTVNIDLTITGESVLALSTDSLDYDTLFIGLESSQLVELLNSGTDWLDITSVSSSNSEFQFSLEDDSLYVMESTLLTVTYVPATDDAVSEQITIESNDPNNPTLTIQLTAVGLVPPEIELSLDSIEVFLSPEDAITKYFTISNTGANNLEYDINISSGNNRHIDRSNLGFYADGSSREIQESPSPLPHKQKNSLTHSNGGSSSRDEGDILNTFYTGINSPTGMVWVGGDLYIVSYGSEQLYKFNRNTEQVDYLFDLHGAPYGITWDGSYLWIGNYEGNVYGYDLNGSQVGSFSVPFGSYPAITFNGSNFIVRYPWDDSAEFYEVDYTGNIQDTYYQTTDYATTYEIVSVSNDNLWGLDYDNNRMVLISLTNSEFQIEDEIYFDFYYYSYNSFFSIAYNGNLWTANFEDGTLYEIDVDGYIQWLSTDITSGTIAPAQSETIEAEFIGSDLSSGRHDAVIQINSNDVEQYELGIDATMRVIGPPSYTVYGGESNYEINFGEVQFMDSSYIDVEITNYDSVDLSISSSMMWDIPSFDILNNSLLILPRTSEWFTVRAHSFVDEGWYGDTLIMETSYPDLPNINIYSLVQSVPRHESVILDIADVASDQGGWVTMEFTRSYWDSWWLTGRTEMYTIEILDNDNWVAANSSVAYEQERYYALVHTLQDSNSVSEGVTDFRVVAGMDEGTWISVAESGYSMDNLPPAVPTGLIAEEEEYISVSWQRNTDEEIQYYEVHKSLNEDFIEDQYSIFTTTDTLIIDTSFTIGQTVFYRLGAVDLAGNMSNYSSVVSITVLGIDDELIPEVFALHQNYPNPFNPITTLRYDLPEQATVNIIIYDMLGRQVKTLLDQTQEAGFKSIIWNATNDYGKPVSAGVYLYKIQAGEFVKTKKMVLLK